MRLSGSLAFAVVALIGAGIPLPAHASDADWGLNGTYVATSNGEWAKTNERFQDEASLRSTWTISTVCSYPSECTGTVASDRVSRSCCLSTSVSLTRVELSSILTRSGPASA